MHSAPSVVYPVGRCSFQARLLIALGGAAALAGMAFLVESNFSSQGVWGSFFRIALILGWLVWVIAACVTWLRSPEGTLRWEPQGGSEGINGAWTWSDGTAAEPAGLSGVERVLDLQSRLLLRIRESGGRPRWVWVERNSHPARWSDLRRALVSSQA